GRSSPLESVLHRRSTAKCLQRRRGNRSSRRPASTPGAAGLGESFLPLAQARSMAAKRNKRIRWRLCNMRRNMAWPRLHSLLDHKALRPEFQLLTGPSCQGSIYPHAERRLVVKAKLPSNSRVLARSLATELNVFDCRLSDSLISHLALRIVKKATTSRFC